VPILLTETNNVTAERRQQMAAMDDVICVTRYCPNCGTEIFCRTDVEKHRVFYISEDMRDPTNTCPQCQFDLFSVPLEALLAEPAHPREKRLLAQGVGAGEKLAEAILARNPKTFTSKAGAKRALHAVGGVLFDLLASGEDVRWSGLGSFKIRHRKPRRGRNPRTGEELHIPGKRVVTFSAGKALKEKLNR
jgi:DNA-binding protein HU-beta